jgi:probable HAF family extracellular repeat protein
MIDIDTRGSEVSEARAINASGVVVGSFEVPGPDAQLLSFAFVYTGGKMLDLNALVAAKSGFSLQEATAVNDAGQIVGFGTNAAGQLHAFLLNPN